MKSRINYNYIYILLLISFIFLWDISFLINQNLIYKKIFNLNLSSELNISFRYLVLFLLFPIFYFLIKKKIFSIIKTFNYQNYIVVVCIFVFVHYFITNILYSQLIKLNEIVSLFFFIILAFIYCNFRNFLIKNFSKLIFFFLFIFVFYSFFKTYNTPNFGACNNNFFLINLFQQNFNFRLSNSFYLENSHMAMMMTSVFFSGFLILTKSKNYFFIILFFLSIIIVWVNSSSTFFVSFILCQFFIFIFFNKKISKKYWVYSFIFFMINLIIFISDNNCKKKVSDFNFRNILEKKITSQNEAGSGKLTSLIYERSSIISLETIRSHTLGWGYDGMQKASAYLLEKPEYNDVYYLVKLLNLKDGLGNFFKLITEFGIFSFLIFIFFIKYLINIPKIIPYNLFIISLFITQCLRGAGYLNGGFAFCLFEFFFINNVSSKNKLIIK